MKIEINGLSINYELSGNEDRPVVIMSHSLCTTLDMWYPQMAVLDPGFRVLRYDTRGHGHSDAPDGAYTLDQLTDDAMGLLDALGIDRFHWVGISMGGMIGQNVALNHADRLQSLVLCDTAAIIPDEAQEIWKDRINTARNQGMQALVQETLQRWFTPSFLKQNPPEIQRIREQILSTPVAGYMGCSEAIRRLNYLEHLSEIPIPTLIIVGEEDPGTPVETSEAIHARIRDSQLNIIPSAAHLCNLEQPESFNKILMDFFQ